jgi:hypothetical protein
MSKSESELHRRDAKHNLGEELLEAIREVKAGCYGRVSVVQVRGRESPPEAAGDETTSSSS